MASVNGVSSSNTVSSLYNSANVISGLASGLDTEGMIENLVKGYQTKIQDLTNKATKLEWKQEAYRSIISKMYAFSNQYTSYTSSTNLMSSAFFNSAVKVASMGANKDKVTASGRTDSDVQLLGVKQLATAARLSTRSNLKGATSSDEAAILAEGADGLQGVDLLNGTFTTGTLSGSLQLKYGNKTVSVVFDKDNDQITGKTAAEKAQSLQDLIVKKLGDTKITLSNGESRTASELIKVDTSGGKISFSDATTGGNTVYISAASDAVKDTLGLDLENASEDKPNSIQVTNSTAFTKTEKIKNYVSGAGMNVSLDGKSKSITLPTIRSTYDGDVFVDKDGKAITDVNGKTLAVNNENYVKLLQESLDNEFGKGKINVENAASDGSLQLKFTAQKNSDLIINSDVGKALGIGNIATNYLNTSKTLGELVDSGAWDKLTPNEEGKYDFTINGVTVGSYDKDTKLSSIISDINANSDAGVKVTYSQTTRKFTFTSKETGADSKVEFGGGLASAMFGTSDNAQNVKDVAGSQTVKELLGRDETVIGQRVSVYIDGKEYGFDLAKDDSTMQRVLNTLNGTKGKLNAAGYEASFSDLDGSLLVTKTNADGTKENVNVVYGNSFSQRIFNKVKDQVAEKAAESQEGYTRGQDAVFSVSVNGDVMEMNRSGNSVDIDGLTLNLKGTFNEGSWKETDGVSAFDPDADLESEAVTFQISTDSDKIVDAVKSMITDFNEMLSEIRSQYATLPYQSSSGAFQTYDPLSDDDKATMSESAIQNYEAKAKQGLLFNDSNLSTLYDRLRSVFAPGGTEEAKLQQIGISLSYSSGDGGASVVLDESKLRAALEEDPDAVANMFTRSASAGSSSNGIMQSLKVQLDRYGSTTGATKGILVEQAGTPLSSLSLLSNDWQKQIDNYGTQIEKWQDKLSAQVDKYTSMFSKLETLIYQMNSQSSTLAGLMGG